MKQLVPMDEYGVFADSNEVARVDSLSIAGFFEKRHDHVLRDIAKITGPKSGLSEDVIKTNFAESFYWDTTGRKLLCYQMTRDGFTVLVMGYTGAKAMRFKELYIKRFNEMEHEDKREEEIIDSLGRKQTAIFINESSLYSLLFSMQPQKANNYGQSNAYPIEIQERIDKLHKFKRWVTSEVLPAIHKHGFYNDSRSGGAIRGILESKSAERTVGGYAVKRQGQNAENSVQCWNWRSAAFGCVQAGVGD